MKRAASVIVILLLILVPLAGCTGTTQEKEIAPGVNRSNIQLQLNGIDVFNFSLREVAPNIKELETLHEVLSPAEIVRVAGHVQNACSRKDFMEKFDAFTAEYVPSLIDNKRYMIQRQGTLRVVIPNQSKVGRRLAFHQGIFVGNGRGCRTIWTPFTKAEKTNKEVL